MSRTDIDDTLRDMWVTRPRRRRSDKKIAGVAAAIGRRYQIDPTLVRVAFVVATVYGGVGIILYLLGWLLLPEEDDEVSPAEAILGRGRSSMSIALTCILGLLLIPASFAVFSGAPSVLLALALAGAALFLLHRNRGGMAPATSSTPVAAAVADQSVVTSPLAPTPGDHETTGASAAAPDAGPAQQGQQNPPAWDPLGVAPFAWDLPEPNPEPPPAPPAPKRRSAVTPVTLALALITAGLGALAAMYSGLGPAQVAAMALAVLGAGLIVGSFVRGGRGLIALAIPLAAVTWGMTVVPVEHIGNVGNREYTPTAAADVLPRYELTVGNLELDLSQLRLIDGQTVTTKVGLLAAGNIEVRVPENADVQATCSANFGNVECLSAEAHGPNPRQTITDVGEDGAGGGNLVLELVHGGTGNVELKRG